MEEIFKPKTRQEIADAYGISRKTFQRWLKKKNITLDAGLIKRPDLELIYQTFGLPPGFDKRNAYNSPKCPKVSQSVPQKLIRTLYLCPVRNLSWQHFFHF